MSKRFTVKGVYIILSILYFIFTLIELAYYFFCDSTLFGLIYLVMSIVIIFFVTTVSINYTTSNPKKRISKVLIAVILGYFSSYVLNSITSNIIDYEVIDTFIIKIYLTKTILKPIIYSLFLFTALYEINMLLKKANKPYFDVKKLIKRIKSTKMK